jgi:hypothetical protein
MIDSPAQPADATRAAQRSRWLSAALVVIASLLVGATPLAQLGRTLKPTRVSATASASPSSFPPPPLAPALPPPVLPPTAPPTVAPPLLQQSGPVPAHGKGEFSYAWGRGPVLGKAGAVRHFRVAVEQGSGEDVAAFATQVEATLGDQRGWIGDGKSRLQRVAGADRADFTVYLATRDTAARMCRAAGTDITVGGRPYTSCRTTGKAIINLDRWRLSAPPYVEAKVPLSVYRQYVINHEVGHEFGHHHEGCPKRGGPAPVMVQQTLTLRGCVPYAWPRRNGYRLAGPQL